jgi:hypothetical protein
MMYATKGWATLEAPPRWWIIDGRGRGSVLWSPLLTLATLGHLTRRRPDLLHLNVAGRGSTLRKMLMSEMAAPPRRMAALAHRPHVPASAVCHRAR